MRNILVIYFLFVINIDLSAQSGVKTMMLPKDISITDFNPGEYVRILEDTENQLTLENILYSKSEARFKNFADFENKFDLNYTYWVKIEFENTEGQASDWIFQIGDFDYGEAYLLDGAGKIELKNTGNLVPHSKKDIIENKGIKSKNLIGFTLLPQQKQTIYLKVKSKLNQIKFDFAVYEKETYKQNYIGDIFVRNLIQGFFQGILWITILYNLLIFLQSKDKTYLYYVFYLMSIAAYVANRFGFLSFINAENPIYIQYIQSFFASFTLILFIQFANSFLNTAKNFKNWYNLFNIMSFVLLLNFIRAAGMIYSGFSILMIANIGNAILLCCVLFFLPFYYTLIKNKTGKYFIISTALLLFFSIISIILFILEYINAEYFFEIGVVSQIILLALGVGHRIRLSELENDFIQKELLRQLKENEELQNKTNVVLEKAILKRTDELTKANDLMQSLLDSNIQSYALINRDFTILTVNRQARFYVRDVQEKTLRTNTNILDYLISERDKTIFKIHFHKALQGQRTNIEYKVREKYVGLVWYNLQYLPAYNQEREIFGVSFSMLDITQRKKAQEKLQERNEELRGKNKKLLELNNIKDKLFSIISHDFRSPLASLKSTLDALKMQLLSEEEKEMVINELDQKLDNTLDSMDNLLYWAKSQLEGSNVNPVILNLKETIEVPIELLKPIAKEKDIKLEYIVDKDILIEADLAMFRTILRNLISNAIKFSRQGGKITVKATLNDKRMQFVQISVIDEGLGISKRNMAKIFSEKDSFTSLGTAMEKGTGLGLMICKEFVEKNNGKIWFESEENIGSTFYFTMPLATK